MQYSFYLHMCVNILFCGGVGARLSYLYQIHLKCQNVIFRFKRIDVVIPYNENILLNLNTNDIIRSLPSLTNCRFLTCATKFEEEKMTKKLAVFDFDHTVVDDNTDIVVRKLLKTEWIPESTKQLYRSNGWTVYMQEIFKLLHKHNIKENSIRDAIINIPAVEAIKDLIIKMVDNLNFDVIIISDSNSLFINDWIVANNLNEYIKKVFTNPAKYNKHGMLQIEMYHVQHECKLSTVNLCKGKIMQDFIKKQKEKGILYNQIVYTGDGKNDFCPILRLKEIDVACVREGFACAELVTKSLQKKSEYNIKANVCIWKTGHDIEKILYK